MLTTPTLAKCHKNVLIALLEGWSLRFVDGRGWRLFPAGRPRAFVTVRPQVVDDLTSADWLSPSIAVIDGEARLVKHLTRLGREVAFAIDRADRNAAAGIEVNPFKPDFASHLETRRAA